jgi:murein DD-endopeptidase MepM/ murein hydrolase activator NlpD
VAGAGPALAAEKADDSALRVTAPTAPAALAAAEQRQAREQRRAIAARKARRNPGPFVPVVGKVDYGTAENAFGAARSGHTHSGHDMFAKSGTPLVAVDDTVVVDAGSDGGQGNYVHLYDAKRNQTYVYMHMVAPTKLKAGDEVKAGEEVGGVGCTGSCWGEHLHFEIRGGESMAGEAHDPLPQLKQWDSIEKPL